MKLFRRLKKLFSQLDELISRVHKIQESLGRIEGRQTIHEWKGNLQDVEYRVFSQWGEDGIIQAIVRELKPQEKIFIEFGVTNYHESNTRFLLMNNNWSGLLIDGNAADISFIKNDPIYWQYNLKAECRFITRENVNQIFLESGISGEIGLLSIDIDGNDYWVWEAIDVVDPAIVIVEYNSRFGSDLAVTVPYDPEFTRTSAHFSCIYYGASLRALEYLGSKKGYVLVGGNSAGNNAFFVRKDLVVNPLRKCEVEDAYVRNQFRETRSVDGELEFLDHVQEQELLADLPLVTVC